MCLMFASLLLITDSMAAKLEGGDGDIAAAMLGDTIGKYIVALLVINSTQ